MESTFQFPYENMKNTVATECMKAGIGGTKGGENTLAILSLPLPSGFVFDSENHSYSIDSKPMPSVTQILAPLNDFSQVNSDVLERAKAFGTAVHETISMDCVGELDTDSLDPILKKILDSFHAIIELNRWKILLSEQKVFHPVHRYAGTFDLLVVDRFKKMHLIELKTRDARPEYDELQTVAYRKAIEAMNWTSKIRIHKRFVLSLYADGEAKLTEVERKEMAWNTFLSLLNFYRWKQNYGGDKP